MVIQGDLNLVLYLARAFKLCHSLIVLILALSSEEQSLNCLDKRSISSEREMNDKYYYCTMTFSQILQIY